MIVTPTVTFYIPKCCILLGDPFQLYCATGGGGGGGIPTAHAHVLMRDPLNCSKARPHDAKVATKFRSLYFIIVKEQFSRATCLYSAVYLERFLQFFLLQWSHYC